MEIGKLKTMLRLKLKELRKAVSLQTIESASDAIIQNCLEGIDWKNIKSVQVYLPITAKKEINTWPLLRQIWQLYPHIKVAVPVIRNGHIYSSLIKEDTMLQPARYGTIEPLHAKLLPGNHKFDLVIVPLLGFDRRGHRLGYGKGYYDKFLSAYKGLTLGLAYSKSEVKPAIPEEKHDVRLKLIATEREFISAV